MRGFHSTKGQMLVSDGAASGLFAIARDITDLKRAEDKRQSQALIAMLRKAVEAIPGPSPCLRPRG